MGAHHAAHLDGTPRQAGRITFLTYGLDGRVESWSFARGQSCTAAFAAARAWLDASGGGALYCPLGIYIGQVVIGANTRLVGDGKGLTVFRGEAGNGYVMDNGTQLVATVGAVGRQRLKFEGFTVDNATLGRQANGVSMMPATELLGTPCSDVDVTDVEVLQYSNHQYGIWNMRGERVRIRNNEVDGGITDFSGLDSGQNGIETFGGNDVMIDGNHVRRCRSSGIHVGSANNLDQAVSTKTSNVIVGKNIVEHSGRGVTMTTTSQQTDDPQVGVNPQNLEAITVEGNQFRNCKDWGVGLYLAYPNTAVKGVLINGNDIADCDQLIRLEGFSHSDEHQGIQCRGNTLRRATSASIGAVYAAQLRDVLIEGNIIEDATYDGIRAASLFESVISKNKIRGCGNNGIKGDAFTDVAVDDNDVRGTGAGAIFIQDSTRDRVRRNHVADFVGVGINVGGTSSNGVIEDNTSHRETPAGSSDFVTSGDAMILRNNRPLYAALGDTSLVSQNLGTNPNYGTVSPAALATFTDVANTQTQSDSGAEAPVVVIQTAGAPNPVTVTKNGTGFRLTYAAAAVGDESYRWEVG